MRLLLNAVCLVEKRQTPIYNLWFNPTGTPTHDLPHLRRACITSSSSLTGTPTHDLPHLRLACITSSSSSMRSSLLTFYLMSNLIIDIFLIFSVWVPSLFADTHGWINQLHECAILLLVYLLIKKRVVNFLFNSENTCTVYY